MLHKLQHKVRQNSSLNAITMKVDIVDNNESISSLSPPSCVRWPEMTIASEHTEAWLLAACRHCCSRCPLQNTGQIVLFVRLKIFAIFQRRTYKAIYLESHVKKFGLCITFLYFQFYIRILLEGARKQPKV